MFGFWKSYRRKRVLAKQPRQDCVDAFHGIWQWRLATKELQEQGLRWCKVFVAEKNWEGCQGLRMTEPMKWTIAGQVALLTTAYPEWFFDQTLSILVYPERMSHRTMSSRSDRELRFMGNLLELAKLGIAVP